MARLPEEEEGRQGRHIGTLPDDCLSHVLSLTTPRDSCRSALVSGAFRSAASSDALWERFLPSDYPSILSRAVDPVEYSSKRELYFRLCDPILVDGGNMSFALERSTGGKCYMIPPRSMNIAWGDDQRYWTWIALAESRFAEVAELLAVCWLDISGKIDCRLLSPRTAYAAYLVFKFSPAGSSGFRDPPQLASVKLGAYTSELNICLKDDDDEYREEEEERLQWQLRWLQWQQQRVQWQHRRLLPRQQQQNRHQHRRLLPRQQEQNRHQHRHRSCLRDDGWLEAKLGEFYNDEGDDGDVEMSLREVKVMLWKKGLIIQGLEVRPKI